MFYDTVRLLLEGYEVGEKVILKHHSLKQGLPRYYKDHNPGDAFIIVKRQESNNPNPKYVIKSVDTGKEYIALGYHIQKADQPLKAVTRVKKRLSGNITCSNCGKEFSLSVEGQKHRDHCPYCLYSVHIDKRPGDREVWCGEGEIGSDNYKHSRLVPVGKGASPSGGYIIKYECEKCGKVKFNRAAPDDNKKEIAKLPEVPIPVKSLAYK